MIVEASSVTVRSILTARISCCRFVQPAPSVRSSVTPHARAASVRGPRSRYAFPLRLSRGDAIAPARKERVLGILILTLAQACVVDTAAASKAIDSFRSRVARFAVIQSKCLEPVKHPLLLLPTTFPLGCSPAPMSVSPSPF